MDERAHQVKELAVKREQEKEEERLWAM